MGSISFLLTPTNRAWMVAGLVAKRTGHVGEKGDETTLSGMMTAGAPLWQQPLRQNRYCSIRPWTAPLGGTDTLKSSLYSIHTAFKQTKLAKIQKYTSVHKLKSQCPGQHHLQLNEETKKKKNKNQWIRLMGKLRREHTLDKWLISTDLTYSFRNNSEVLYSFWTQAIQCWWQNVAKSHQTHNHLHPQSVVRSVFSQQLRAVWSGNYNSIHTHNRLLRTRPLPSTTSCRAALQWNCSSPTRLWKWGTSWFVLFVGQFSQKNTCFQRRNWLPSAGDYAPHIDNMIIYFFITYNLRNEETLEIMCL